MSAGSQRISIKNGLAAALYDCSHIQAATLYGSTARGDAEAHSDIDLLVVCEGSTKRETYVEVETKLRGELNRLSVSIYTPRELCFLAKVQSLFLLHLSRECVVLFDRTGLLTQ